MVDRSTRVENTAVACRVVRNSWSLLVMVGLATAILLRLLVAARAAEQPASAASTTTQRDRNPSSQKSGPYSAWIATGRVTDEHGQPIDRATIRWGTHLAGGSTETDHDGRYSVHFWPGLLEMPDAGGKPPLNLTWVNFLASAPGRTERNLGRQGLRCPAAFRAPEQSDMAPELRGKELCLPGRPLTIDFVLVPAATVHVRMSESVPNDGQPTSISLVCDAMPQGWSVLATAPIDRSGSFTLHQVSTSYACRFQANFTRFEANFSRPGQSVRSRPFTISMPRAYDASLSLHEVPQLKPTVLRIDGFTDAGGRDIRQDVVGEDPFCDEPARTDEQIRGHELLRKVAQANRHWLNEPPANVRTWSYVFHSKDGTTTRYEIPQNRHVPRGQLDGTRYVPLLSYLTRANSKNGIVIRRIDEKEGLVRVWYTLRNPIDVRGLEVDSSGLARDMVLDIDAKTFTPRRHVAMSPGGFRESFADFVPCGEGTYAPRSVQVTIFNQEFDFGFVVYDPGLWLFAESRGRAPDGKPVILERIADVMINDQAGRARK